MQVSKKCPKKIEVQAQIVCNQLAISINSNDHIKLDN
jgi:hypothetical protein